ncbi:hypothetical protein A3A14_00135 [Candidatus Daviesbacteria bacterium RIFCSPLOWO2_01_FULL_43_38]|uniref:DUF948 domain-containing protein n=3 Tax=Candidatus Daviesiibacteriota TaxID=1752718 RepID=A0A1F5K4M1_9BACT|nr:MAG: hypothetical protein UV33_C0008G0008 [Candidatus Daviesbacteria bacterium GW2011_GWA1_42_6]KKS70944.1 MAG: hypothetical protein UV41_C0009G0003 [Candidatus Daviesbacteria bacterium GW2011_GWA2_42_7]OGE20004.1 MAG: hypothetical protein A2874_00775 [Candidatus Daviesbacteria bacterium RIFCSPHIGHO2_01_FULL_43_17]OGE35754.1 MAG: hypothetical protein A3E45_00460 [Candidatus Daviesbacteria bacterium RIFCSPHIGHO2_12_FULL_43_11]OGE63439.1 MAG: hypothetical protein A3A14_00135 [Candidatus Davies
MEPRNILYISISIAALIFAGALAFAAFRLAQVLKALKILVEDIEDTTKDVRLLKDKLKSSSFSLIALLLKSLVKKNLSKRAVK